MRWPYDQIGVTTTRAFRNLINKVFGDIGADMQEHAERADNLQGQINELVVNGDSSPQAAQASVGADGTDYNGNLKARLDAEYNKTTAQLADITSQEFKSMYQKRYKGFNMYLPFSSQYGTYQTVIDNAVKLGANTINICIRLTMDSATDESISLSTTQSDLINVVTYAKTKGLYVFIKPHVNYSSWDISQNIVSLTNWLNSYSSNLKTALSWVASIIDIVGVSNELAYQTNSNTDFWKALINDIRSLAPNVLISCSITTKEISTNTYLPYVDLIGCNTYIGVGGNSNSPVQPLLKNMFRDYDTNNDYLTALHKKANDLGKKILITEVGILPVEDALKHPAKYDYDSSLMTQPKVQTLYYQVALETFFSDTIVDGVMIWSLTDGFTPIGNSDCEDVILSYFGGAK